MLIPKNLNLSIYNSINFPVTILDGQGKPYVNQTVYYNCDGLAASRITNGSGIATIPNDLIPVDNKYHVLSVSYKVSKTLKMMG